MAATGLIMGIAQAESEGDLGHIRLLFREYAASLGFSLCFQGFEKELAELPGDYAPAAGRLLLARVGADASGCVGLRKISDGVCETRRLCVCPERAAICSTKSGDWTLVSGATAGGDITLALPSHVIFCF